MISEKLMMSLFALDAYSRSKNDDDLKDDVRLFGLGSDGSVLGDATIVATENVPGSSFVAVAYSWNGKTVLSFRGTDAANIWLDGDIWNGWSLGAGFDIASQAGLAASFYEAMTGQSLFAPASGNVILTGHSLGGGLAGYLSALNGTKAYGFDHMVFGPAAEARLASHLHSLGITDPTEQQLAALGIRLPDASKFIGTHVENEILVDVRNGDYAKLGANLSTALFPVLGPLGMGGSWLLNALSQAQAAYESNVANGMLPTFGWNQSIFPNPLAENELHSQALLVLLQFAQDEIIGGQWANSGFAIPLLNSLYSDAVAEDAGIFQGETPGQNISGKSPPADLMLTKIAYSVLDSGNRPFGDSAIRSLFNDAEAVGAFLNDGANPLLDLQKVADDIALFAALQTQHSVMGEHSGFVSHQQSMLALDYTQSTWSFGDHLHSLPGFARDFSTYLNDDTLSALEKVNLDTGPGRIEFEYYSNAVGGWHGQIGHQSALNTVKAVGTGTMDTIIGTDGDEQIWLGGGHDTVKANGGVNWIDGGDGDDKLIDDHAWADFEITQDAQTGRYYFALRGSGNDPRIHVLDNVELFRLAGEDFDASDILNVAPEAVTVDWLAGSAEYQGLRRGSYLPGAVIADLGVVDGNEHDRFTWEVVGGGSAFYSVDANGVLRTKVSVTYDYNYWRQQVGQLTLQQWQDDDLSSGFASLLGTQYAVTVKVTDAAGAYHFEDIYLYLRDGDETVFGTPQNDVLVGGTGRSVIAGLAGADQISDNDWLVLDYSASDAGVTITASTPRILVGQGGHAQGDVINLSSSTRLDIIGSAFNDVLNGTPIVGQFGMNEIFGGKGNDTINGSSGYNILHGEEGDDTINGGYDTDYIYGGAGYDIIRAGSGYNYVDFGSGGGELIFDVRTYANMQTNEFRSLGYPAGSQEKTDVIGVFENITASSSNDELHGNEAGNVLKGNGGYDLIYGYGGEDTIIFSSGYGYGGSGNDTITTTGQLGTALVGEGNDVVYAKGLESYGIGQDGDDVLYATGSWVRLIGGAGSDTFYFQGSYGYLHYIDSTSGIRLEQVGNQVFGYAGDALGDVINGKFNVEGSNHDDEIILNTASWSLVRGWDGDDNIIVTGGANVYGGSGNDTILSDGTIYGDAGADTITSAVGSHNIYLGVDDDVDTFVFSRLTGLDRLYEFDVEDVIRIGSGYKYDDFGDILQNSQQVGNDVQIWFESNTKITIANYQLANLTADNFLFV